MNSKERLEKKIKYEMKEFVMVFLYLAILIGSFNAYKWLLMAEYHVGYFVYGYTLFEALVLAKVIIVGESLGIGERFSNQPLIFSTLYKTLLFTSRAGLRHPGAPHYGISAREGCGGSLSRGNQGPVRSCPAF